MTRRERLERKLEKRREWAGKAEARSAERFGAAHALAAQIPLGQPILVGHHSERRARRDADRIHANLTKGVEAGKLAEHHGACAAGIERQLETCIFTDDPDAVEALAAKIAKLEAQQAKMKAANAAIRKHAKAGREAQVAALAALELPASLLEPDFAGRVGFPAFALTNLAANIRRLKGRVEEVKVRQARQAKAETVGVLIEGATWVRVTFPEKPAREVLDALRAAGFRWGKGSWIGERARLPPAVMGGAP